MPRTSKSKIRITERRKEVLKLRTAEHTIRDIVKILNERGIKVSRTTVHKDIDTILKERKEETYKYADKVVAIELSKIDELHKSIWPKALNGDLYALDRILKLQERKAKLLGLDAPSKQEIIDKPKSIQVEFIESNDTQSKAD